MNREHREPPTPAQREREQADQLFAVAERAGTMVDDLFFLLRDHKLTPEQLTTTANRVRRLVFAEACRVAQISAMVKDSVIAGDVVDERT